jgi:hypothetical protein
MHTHTHTHTHMRIHTHTHRYYIWHQPASATSMYITIHALPSIDKDDSDSAVDTRQYILYAAKGKRPSQHDFDADLIFDEANMNRLTSSGNEKILRVEPKEGGYVCMFVCCWHVFMYLLVCSCIFVFDHVGDRYVQETNKS